MHFRDLQEADVPNFADQAEKTLGDVASKASAAYGKLKSAYKNAEGEVRGELIRSATDQQRQGEKDAAAKQKAAKDALNAAAEGGAPAIISNLVLGKQDPAIEDLAAIDDFDAEAYQKFQTNLELVEKRVLGLPKLLKQALKTADFLNGADRTDPKITELLADVDDAKLDPIERAMVNSTNGDLDMWRFALSNDDQTAVAKRMISQLTKVAAANERKNLAATGSGRGKAFYVGSGLVRVLRGQMQVIERRLATLKELVRDHESRPVTEALQRRVRKLVKNLNS